jgi:hypothetical protein
VRFIDDPHCCQTVLRTQVWRGSGKEDPETKRNIKRKGEKEVGGKTGMEEKTVSTRGKVETKCQGT